MKKYLGLAIIILMLLNIFSVVFIDNKPIKADTTYYETFSGYSDGTDEIDSFYNGVNWLNTSLITGAGAGGIYTVGGNARFYLQRNNGLTYASNWSFFVSAQSISYLVTYPSVPNARWFSNFYYRNDENEQLLRIYALDTSDGYTPASRHVDISVYDDNDQLIASNSSADPTSSLIITTINTTTSEIRIQITNTNIDVWYDVDEDVFDFVNNIYFYQDQQEDTYNYWIDNLILSSTTDEYYWELDYNSIGDVATDKDNTYLVDYTFGVPMERTIEGQRKGLNSNITVKQIAIQISDSSVFDNTEFYFRIGNQVTNVYNTSYEFDDTYILVWKNLDINTGYVTHLLYELKIILGDSNQEIYFSTSNSDVDGDGDTEFKSSANINYFDGLYNGVNTFSRDLIIEIWYELESGGGQEDGDFFVYFYDLESGNRLTLFGSSQDAYGDNYIEASFESDLWTGEYNSGKYDQPHPVTADFTNGDTHYLYIEGFQGNEFTGKIDGVSKTFDRFTYSNALYHGQTYYLYVEPTGYSEQDWWCFEMIFGSTLPWQEEYKGTMCLDKRTYDYGEQILCKYKLPSKRWLKEHGLPANNWYCELYEDSGFLYDTLRHTFYQDTDFFFDGTWHEDVSFNATTYYGIQNYWAEYYFWWKHDDYGFFKEPMSPKFICTGSGFVPDGEIVSVTPTNVYSGQTVQIVFNANNNGHMTFYHIESKKIVHTETFDKFSGNDIINYRPALLGHYSIDLYVNPWWNESRDTDYFAVDNYGGNFSDFGYQHEFLYIPDYKIVAGFSNVSIFYNTFKINSTLTIYSPKGSTTFFSTTLENTSGLYTFETHAWMQIGTWEVVMNATTELNESFNIIADENNWIEFSKNVYYDDEYFEVWIKHDVRVILQFNKWEVSTGAWIPQGTDKLIEAHENVEDLLPIFEVPLSVGNWNVEMWEVNNRIRIRELAEWECRVIKRPFVEPFSETDILPKLDSLLGAIVGLIVVLCCLLSPLFIAKGLKVKDGVPPEAYSLSGGIGVVVCVIFGWFPFWVLLFIVLIAVIMIVVKYLQKSSSSGN